MRKIVDPPITDMSTEEFGHILKGKLQTLMTAKAIAGVESVEKSTFNGTICFMVRILFGETGYADFIITKWRLVGITDVSMFDAGPQGGRWAGRAFAKFVEDSIAPKATPSSSYREMSEQLAKGSMALSRRYQG